MMFHLRPYQEAAVEAGLKAISGKKHSIVVLPTGSGKSLVIASLAKRLGGRAIVLQPTREILQQNHSKMIAFGHSDVEVYSASMNRKRIGAVTLATIGSVIRKKELFEDFDWILVDECHLVNSKGGMYEEFINSLGHRTIGFTATPYRLRSYNDNFSGERVAVSTLLTRTRPRIFSAIAHITQVGELFESGHLAYLNYSENRDYDASNIRSNSTGQGFDDVALERYNTSQDIVGKTIEAVAGSTRNHILAFTQLLSDSRAVLTGLAAKGIPAAEVAGTTPKPEREDVLRRFRSGELRCVVNVGVLTTGFDFPELAHIVLGRPTKSVALYYQMIGRGVRPAAGKGQCKVSDLCDNVRRFGKIETFHLYDVNGNQMWRLKSDAGDLTGVDVTTGQLLEKVKQRKGSHAQVR